MLNFTYYRKSEHLTADDHSHISCLLPDINYHSSGDLFGKSHCISFNYETKESDKSLGGLGCKPGLASWISSWKLQPRPIQGM